MQSSVSELPSELQNKAMRPFVLLKERVAKSVSLHELVSLVKEADDQEDEVIALINRYSAEQAARQSEVSVVPPSQVQEPSVGSRGASTVENTTVEKPVAKPKPVLKPIELVSPTELLGGSHLFIETEQDIDAYLSKLRSRLQQAIVDGKRVRIK